MVAHATTPRLLLSLGEVLGGCYEVRRVLGVGAMGQVYEAIDRELNRLVAIKVARPDEEGDALRNEARVMAAFQHSGMTTVYAMGEHRGIPFVVMERLAGRSLADHLDEGVFGASETRDVVLAVAEGLSVLHGAKLVHRDLKPANIMLVPPRRVVLVDFGVTDMEQYVAGDNLSGTLNYIPPEAARGEVRVGEAHLTDIYALGVVGFQMLTGRLPYLSASLIDLLGQLLAEDVPSIRKIRPGVYEPLAEIVMEMLARDPADRPTSIDVVASRLRDMHIAEESRLTERAASRREPPDGEPVRVLVTDDEPAIWTLLSYVLEDKGYEIVFVDDGERALEEFEKGPFEIVIIDKRMSRVGGIELLREVKKRRPSTDVVLITGSLARQTVVQTGPGGAAFLIEKPFDLDEVADMVTRLAKRQRALRADAAQ